MKLIILFIIMLATSIQSYAQVNGTKQKVTAKETPKQLSIDNQRNARGSKTDELPDLTIVSFAARYLGTLVISGVTQNQVEISYTIKNEGTSSVLANLVGWQGWISYESLHPQMIAAGGAALAAPSSTEVLEPGGTIQRTFRITAAFDKNSHPLYTMYLDNFNTVKESNEQNNIAQKPISF